MHPLSRAERKAYRRQLSRTFKDITDGDVFQINHYGLEVRVTGGRGRKPIVTFGKNESSSSDDDGVRDGDSGGGSGSGVNSDDDSDGDSDGINFEDGNGEDGSGRDDNGEDNNYDDDYINFVDR